MTQTTPSPRPAARPGRRIEPGVGLLDNPYASGLYAPIGRERHLTDEDMVIEGTVPRDISGVYLRNGPDLRWQPPGRYHWFDGDGMVHAVRFDEGRVAYRNRWVETAALRREDEEGRAVWSGLLEPRGQNPPEAPEKDTANTDVLVHHGSVLALWYRAGAPYDLDPRTLETLGTDDFRATLSCDVSAHAKVDERTEELMFFDYGEHTPYMRHGVVGPDGRVTSLVDIDLPGPRLPHDMAITANHSILMDLPLVNDPEAAKAGRYKIGFLPDTPARFGVIPRHGRGDEIRWFEADPTYIYHVSNAWETDDAVEMIACRITDPAPRVPVGGPLGSMLASLRPDAVAHHYRFDLRTGQTTERPLDDVLTEFPAINQGFSGHRNRHAWHMHIADEDTMLHDALIAYDWEQDRSEVHHFGPGRFASEVVFAPRDGATAEDDGYVITFVTDAAAMTTAVEVFDARDITADPVCRIHLGVRVPLGFHATWAADARTGAAA